MNNFTEFENFLFDFEKFVVKNPKIIKTLLSNIFTMRLIGNKTHGDLAEIAICEFINSYMDDFNALHVGKDLFRAKNREEDIEIVKNKTQIKFPISLKAYGQGPLQLSTDKKSELFLLLENSDVDDGSVVDKIFGMDAFQTFDSLNTLALIYNEKRMQCNILVFDFNRIKAETTFIRKISEGNRRKHPVYKFFNMSGDYLFEVRYGNTTANALQRGVWTNTEKTLGYFRSLSNGWIKYDYNQNLLKLMFKILIADEIKHINCLNSLKE